MLPERLRMRARFAWLIVAAVLVAGCGARVSHEQKLAARGSGIGAGGAAKGSSSDNASGGTGDASGTADASALGGGTSSGGGTGSGAAATNKATSADKATA